MNGKLFTVIKSMYDDVKSCIRLNNEYSDFYKSFKGLIQGDALFPLIFSLFVNDIELELMNSDCPSLQIQDINLFLLMYADDTVLLAETPENLQLLLDSLYTYTEKSGLKVNTAKTKNVVFRSSWHMYETEHWSYNNENIEVLNTFRYLGSCLNYTGKFSITQKKCWLRKRKKAIFCLMKQINNHHFNMKTKLDLFDTYVGSILGYGCEIWSHHKGPDIERLHLNFMKRLLGVKRSTHNMMVYRLLARFPLHINRCVRLVKYWLRIKSSNNCIVHSVYTCY